jgi:hypothetical protein
MDFHSQNIKYEIISIIIKYISDKKIKLIDLGGNYIISKGCEAIADHFVHLFLPINYF